jgi:hypothetical protein
MIRLSDERQPRFGAILAGVKRRQDTRVPRARQAPDGRTSGGTQPTDISRINRRDDWLRLFRWSGDNTWPWTIDVLSEKPLDLGSHINAGPQPRLEAEATEERGL